MQNELNLVTVQMKIGCSGLITIGVVSLWSVSKSMLSNLLPSGTTIFREIVLLFCGLVSCVR